MFVLEETKKSLELAVNSWKTRSQLAPKIGKGKYVLAEYEKLKRITMSLGDEHLLYITTEPEAHHSMIIERVMTLKLADLKEHAKAKLIKTSSPIFSSKIPE